MLTETVSNAVTSSPPRASRPGSRCSWLDRKLAVGCSCSNQRRPPTSTSSVRCMPSTADASMDGDWYSRSAAAGDTPPARPMSDRVTDRLCICP